MNTALILVFTLVSLISFIAILVGADPYTSNSFIRVLFFITLFFSLMGIFTLIGARVSKSMITAFRRGFLLAALALSIVLLENFSVLNLGNAFAMFLLVVAIEMIATYRK
jgi:hypothetical protein